MKEALSRESSLSQRNGMKKLRSDPLTLPSPAKGEGKDIEIFQEVISPLRGEARVGVIKGIFSHLGGEGGFCHYGDPRIS